MLQFFLGLRQFFGEALVTLVEIMMERELCNCIRQDVELLPFALGKRRDAFNICHESQVNAARLEQMEKLIVSFCEHNVQAQSLGRLFSDQYTSTNGNCPVIGVLVRWQY